MERCERCTAALEVEGAAAAALACSTCAAVGFAAARFCSAACVAASLDDHRWLHQCRPRPPPGVSPAIRAPLGRVLVATSAFAAGDIVLRETPLLCGDTWAECFEQFRDVLTSDERARVLSFLAPDDADQRDDAERFGRRAIPDAGAGGRELASRLAAVLHNNAIQLGERARTGLYDLASLVAHSCRPNVEGEVDRDDGADRWVLRALRPIAAGDVLGWNYNLPLRSLMSSTPVRRADTLELRGFVCQCERCCRPDFLRSFRCDRCPAGIVTTTDRGPLVPTEFACQMCSAAIDPARQDAIEAEERSVYYALKERELEPRALLARAIATLGPFHAYTGEAAVALAAADPSSKEAHEAVRRFLESPSMVDVAIARDFMLDRVRRYT